MGHLTQLYTFISLSSSCILFAIVTHFFFVKNKPNLVHVYGVGLLYSLISFSWLATTYPLASFGVDKISGAILACTIYTATASAASIPFIVLYGALSIFHKKKYPTYLAYIVLTIFAFILGPLRSLSLWLFYKAPNISFGNYWLFGDPSLALALSPLKLLYTFIPTIFIPLFFSSIGICLYKMYIINTSSIKRFYLLLCCLTFVGVLSLQSNPIPLATETSQEFLLQGQKILVLGTKNSSLIKEQEQIEKSIREHNPVSYDAIFIPEDIGISNAVKKLTQNSTHIIYGDTIYKGRNMYNVIMSQEKNHEALQVTGKRFLIPFGEYMPSLFSFIGITLLHNEDFYRVAHERDYTSTSGITSLQIGSSTALVGLCSDAWSYEGLTITKEHSGATLFLLQSNTIFNNNPWYLTHLYAWHNMHAYTSNIQIISVANDSPLWTVDGRRPAKQP